MAKAVRDNGYLWTPIPFKSRLLDNITFADARQLHRDLSKTPIMANAVLRFLRSLFNYAIDEKFYVGSNPIVLFKAKQNNRKRRVESFSMPMRAGNVTSSEKNCLRFLAPWLPSRMRISVI